MANLVAFVVIVVVSRYVKYYYALLCYVMGYKRISEPGTNIKGKGAFISLSAPAVDKILWCVAHLFSCQNENVVMLGSVGIGVVAFSFS